MDQSTHVPPSDAVRQDSAAGNAPDPRKHYDTPESLAEDEDLDPAHREALLADWRYGIEQRLDAEAEGMGAADVAVIPDVSHLSDELGDVANAQTAATAAEPAGSYEAAKSHTEIADEASDFASEGVTQMNQETAMTDSIRSALATPVVEKVGEFFESNPLLASAAAFVTTRIALRSLTGLFAVGIIAGGLLYLRESESSEMKDARKLAQKAKKKVAKSLRNMAEAQTA